ncbi:hypothetical protein [Amycolatopsis sp. NPDC004378]
MTGARDVAGTVAAARRLLAVAGAIAGFWLLSWLVSGHAQADPLGAVVPPAGSGVVAPAAGAALEGSSQARSAVRAGSAPVAEPVSQPRSAARVGSAAPVSRPSATEPIVASVRPAVPVAGAAKPVVRPVATSARSVAAPVVALAKPVVDAVVLPAVPVAGAATPVVRPVAESARSAAEPVVALANPVVARVSRPVADVVKLAEPVARGVASTAPVIEPVVNAVAPVSRLVGSVVPVIKPVLDATAPVIEPVATGVSPGTTAPTTRPGIVPPLTEPVDAETPLANSLTREADLGRAIFAAPPKAKPAGRVPASRTRPAVTTKTPEHRTSATTAHQPGDTPGPRGPAPADAAWGSSPTVPPAFLTPGSGPRATRAFAPSHGDFLPLWRPCKPGTGPG